VRLPRLVRPSTYIVPVVGMKCPVNRDMWQLEVALIDMPMAFAEARANYSQLDSRDGLEQATKALLAACGDVRGWQLMAASARAERVLGAAVMIDVDASTAPAARVMVIDVNIASGTLLARASERARRAGAREVVGVALHTLGDHIPAAADCLVDELRIVTR
jgi:hypothetical protein